MSTTILIRIRFIWDGYNRLAVLISGVLGLHQNNRRLYHNDKGHPAGSCSSSLAHGEIQPEHGNLDKTDVVSKDRLRAFGCSFASPAAPNTTEDGRAKNRRVELVKWN